MLLTYSNRSDKIQLIEGDNVIYQITTEKKELELLKNDDLSDNNTLSIIDLGQCESILKGIYNLDDNDTLIYLKQERLSEKIIRKRDSI